MPDLQSILQALGGNLRNFRLPGAGQNFMGPPATPPPTPPADPFSGGGSVFGGGNRPTPPWVNNPDWRPPWMQQAAGGDGSTPAAGGGLSWLQNIPGLPDWIQNMFTSWQNGSNPWSQGSGFPWHHGPWHQGQGNGQGNGTPYNPGDWRNGFQGASWFNGGGGSGVDLTGQPPGTPASPGQPPVTTGGAATNNPWMGGSTPTGNRQYSSSSTNVSGGFGGGITRPTAPTAPTAPTPVGGTAQKKTLGGVFR